ncbi:MAG: histidine kinase [Pseudomonadota bacterium]
MMRERMQTVFSEIYLVDGDTLRFVQVNDAACENLQYEAHELTGMSPASIARNVDQKTIERMLQPLRNGQKSQVALDLIHVRKDGSSYPVELQLFRCTSGSSPVFIALGNDVSTRQESADAASRIESRLHKILSQVPGLVYQFRLQRDGLVSFPFLSEACLALLGLTGNQLRADPAQFLALILPEHREHYLESMAVSAAKLSAWNWEGRIWVRGWEDMKWINLRASPQALVDGSVQWEGIMTNITQSKLEAAELARSRTRLAELSAHVETVKEQERMRIAREIHDDLGGNLTAIKMSLALLTRKLPAAEPALTEKALYIDALVDRSIDAVSRIAEDLRPGLLDVGLVAAIDWQKKEFEKQLGIRCEFSSNRENITLHLDQATALFRIFQEALTNVGKHAQASQVVVRLVCTNRSVLLEIADNGLGFTAADRFKPNSFGIRGMEERAVAMRGKLTISIAPEGGSVVAVRIPLRPMN